jgi:hypothetical protein
MGPSELAAPFFATQGTLTGGLLNRAASKHAEFIGFDEKKLPPGNPVVARFNHRHLWARAGTHAEGARA